MSTRYSSKATCKVLKFVRYLMNILENREKTSTAHHNDSSLTDKQRNKHFKRLLKLKKNIRQKQKQKQTKQSPLSTSFNVKKLKHSLSYPLLLSSSSSNSNLNKNTYCVGCFSLFQMDTTSSTRPVENICSKCSSLSVFKCAASFCDQQQQQTSRPVRCIQCSRLEIFINLSQSGKKSTTRRPLFSFTSRLAFKLNDYHVANLCVIIFISTIFYLYKFQSTD